MGPGADRRRRAHLAAGRGAVGVPAGRLILADRDGSHQRRIAGTESLSLVRGPFPSWSPDGRWLLAMDEMGRYYLVDARARAVHPLEAQVVYGRPEEGWYLAGTIPAESLERYEGGEEVPIEAYRCAPLGACGWPSSAMGGREPSRNQTAVATER